MLKSNCLGTFIEVRKDDDFGAYLGFYITVAPKIAFEIHFEAPS